MSPRQKFLIQNSDYNVIDIDSVEDNNIPSSDSDDIKQRVDSNLKNLRSSI